MVPQMALLPAPHWGGLRAVANHKTPLRCASEGALGTIQRVNTLLQLRLCVFIHLFPKLLVSWRQPVSANVERLFSNNTAGFGSSLSTRRPRGWLQVRTLRAGQLFLSLCLPFPCSLSSSSGLLPSCARPTQIAFLFPLGISRSNELGRSSPLSSPEQPCG